MSRTAIAVKDKAERIRERFAELCRKTNVEHPRPADVKALADLLEDHQSMELWRSVASTAQLAESIVIENAPGVPSMKVCWKHRLQSLKKELGYEDAPALEQLFIRL